MSRFRRFSLFYMAVMLFILLIGNVILLGKEKQNTGHQYKVDISRISSRIESGESFGDINLEDYPEVIKISVFDENTVYKEEYVIKSINGILYCFEYKEASDYHIVVFNVLLLIGIFLAAFLLIYLDMAVVAPFSRMNKMTEELAKGNLTAPVKQEKSRYFKRFLWGVDMLRETLEDDKRKELELVKEKKTLILSLSHDIKTPLAAIDLYVKALKRNLYETKEERDNAIQGIENNISEIKNYIQKITDASRNDFLTLEVNAKEIYLSAVLDHLEAYYKETMQAFRIKFSVDKGNDCLVYADKDRLIEVLQNILENAIKYGDKEVISVSSFEEEDRRLVTVMNTGCKLPKEEIMSLFDPFYRGSNASSIQGSGLGLFICKELMHKMDGEVFADVSNGNFEITVVIKKV